MDAELCTLDEILADRATVTLTWGKGHITLTYPPSVVTDAYVIESQVAAQDARDRLRAVQADSRAAELAQLEARMATKAAAAAAAAAAAMPDSPGAERAAKLAADADADAAELAAMQARHAADAKTLDVNDRFAALQQAGRDVSNQNLLRVVLAWNLSITDTDRAAQRITPITLDALHRLPDKLKDEMWDAIVKDASAVPTTPSSDSSPGTTPQT
jgi:hypothetical protein